MTEKKDWLREWQEEQQREHDDALRRHYRRLVEEEKFPDNKDSWAAFVHGWCGTSQWQRAKREKHEAGQNSYLTMTMLWLIGGLLVSVTALMLFMAYDRIIISNTISIGLIGLVLLLLGESLRRRWLRQSREAEADFKAKWASTSQRK